MSPATTRRSRTSAASRDELRDIMRAVRGLVATLGKSARAVERQTGITNAQLFILRHLERDHTLSINDIAALALTHQSAASVVVSRLERGGFVRRTRSPDDARRVMVSLTAAGRRLVRAAPPPPTSRVLTALRTLPPNDLRALGAGLSSLSRALGTGGGEPMMLFEPRPFARKP